MLQSCYKIKISLSEATCRQQTAAFSESDIPLSIGYLSVFPIRKRRLYSMLLNFQCYNRFGRQFYFQSIFGQLGTFEIGQFH